MQPLVPPTGELSSSERVRYSRQTLLSGFGEAAQLSLKNAKVLVVGAGGLGAPALLYLTAAGVGTIGVIDDDDVHLSNLHRQVVHADASIGQPKVASASRRLRELNPSVHVTPHAQRLVAADAAALVASYDIVLDGSDNFATRYLVNDACVLTGTPLVWAAVLRFDAQVSVFWKGHGPCYRCVFPEPPDPTAVPSCAEAGVIGAMCGVVGSTQALEAIKIITGVGEPLLGRMGVYDALSSGWARMPIAANPGCPACGPEATIASLQDLPTTCATPAGAEIDVVTLRRWLDERTRGERSFVLVDVREDQERLINAIDESLHLPLGRFADEVDDLPAGDLVLYCRAGQRSARAAGLAQARGRRAITVDGGVSAWIRDVDPSMPDY